MHNECARNLALVGSIIESMSGLEYCRYMARVHAPDPGPGMTQRLSDWTIVYRYFIINHGVRGPVGV